MTTSMPAKRGFLRPNGHSSRAPMFIVIGLLFICFLLVYNYMGVTTKAKELLNRVEITQLKMRDCESRTKELSSTNEALQSKNRVLSESFENAERKQKDAEEKLASLTNTQQEHSDSLKDVQDQLKLKETEVENLKASCDDCMRNQTMLRSQIESLERRLKLAEESRQAANTGVAASNNRNFENNNQGERQDKSYNINNKNQQASITEASKIAEKQPDAAMNYLKNKFGAESVNSSGYDNDHSKEQQVEVITSAKGLLEPNKDRAAADEKLPEEHRADSQNSIGNRKELPLQKADATTLKPSLRIDSVESVFAAPKQNESSGERVERKFQWPGPKERAQLANVLSADKVRTDKENQAGAVDKKNANESSVPERLGSDGAEVVNKNTDEVKQKADVHDGNDKFEEKDGQRPENVVVAEKSADKASKVNQTENVNEENNAGFVRDPNFDQIPEPIRPKTGSSGEKGTVEKEPEDVKENVGSEQIASPLGEEVKTGLNDKTGDKRPSDDFVGENKDRQNLNEGLEEDNVVQGIESPRKIVDNDNGLEEKDEKSFNFEDREKSLKAKPDEAVFIKERPKNELNQNQPMR